MDQPHDLPAPRRTLWIPVVIATVVLIALAILGGSVLAGQDRDRRDGQGQQEPGPVYTPPSPDPTRDPDPDPDPDPTPQTTSTGRPCRPETQKMGRSQGAAGVLTEVLKLRTRTSTVWICEDQAQAYYYHANSGGEKGKWVEGETALFLPGVEGQGDAWVVSAPDGVRFSVNTDRLLIIHKDGSEEEQKAA